MTKLELKLQTPSIKLPRTSKSQAPTPPTRRTGRLELGNWTFSGAWCLVLGFFLISQTSAQTNLTLPPPVSNRYLLIVETSRVMDRRADGTLKSVQSLLDSSLKAQFHNGDTLGVWTFNDELYAGQFPLQQWSPETHQAVVKRTISFLQQQKYQKLARLDKVLPAMNQLIKASPFITFILITDGSQPLMGSPFDNQINSTYKRWQTVQQKKRLPFITVLRANGGKVTGYAVTAPPWPLEMPPLPAELDSPKVAEVEPAKPPSPVQTQHILPNIILSGRKIDQTNDTEQAAIKPEPPSAVPSSPSPAPTQPPLIVSSIALITQPETNITSGSLPGTHPENPSTKNSTLKTEDSTTVQTPPPVPTIASKPHESNAPASATETDLKPDTKNSTLNTQDSSPQVASALPPEPFINHRILWIGGLSLLALAGASAWLIVRRSRSQGSLITRSLERGRKA